MSAHIVIEGSDIAFHEVVARLARDFHVTDGFGDRGARVCAGVVADGGDAADALLAAVDGARLVVLATGERADMDQFLDDLRRIGAVDHRVGRQRADDLDLEERLLLRELTAGVPLGEAARQLHLSRRTADRRLASARQTLGTATTAQAVVAYSAAYRAAH